MSSNSIEIRLITEKDLATALVMQPQSLADWRHRGQGPRYLKLGHLVRYQVADVQTWLNTLSKGGAL